MTMWPVADRITVLPSLSPLTQPHPFINKLAVLTSFYADKAEERKSEWKGGEASEDEQVDLMKRQEARSDAEDRLRKLFFPFLPSRS